jgi:hypothetical protein
VVELTFDKKKLDAIYQKTDGYCHLCRKKIARKNYGNTVARGAWEVEHSKPRSKGGTDHGNNLYAACITCNRSKGNSSTRTARSKNEFKGAPYSAAMKKKNAVFGAGIGGALAWLLVPPPIKAGAALIGIVAGGFFGANTEPD